MLGSELDFKGMTAQGPDEAGWGSHLAGFNKIRAQVCMLTEPAHLKHH